MSLRHCQSLHWNLNTQICCCSSVHKPECCPAQEVGWLWWDFWRFKKVVGVLVHVLFQKLMLSWWLSSSPTPPLSSFLGTLTVLVFSQASDSFLCKLTPLAGLKYLFFFFISFLFKYSKIKFSIPTHLKTPKSSRLALTHFPTPRLGPYYFITSPNHRNNLISVEPRMKKRH